MSEELSPERPEGIPGSGLSGPHPVGRYAAALRERLKDFARVQVFGEVWGFKVARARVYFELRDAEGALPCSMWRRDWEALGIPQLADGCQVVAAGGTEYYVGSRTSSPGFSFAVTDLREAGEGDLLAQLERLRRTLHAEGLFEPQKALPRPSLPRVIGVVTGESGKARDDVLAGLARRGWAGRIVWAFAPVQDRHAAPAIARALQDLAACEEVEVVIVARGGGSLADLFAFCDETLCRTVALLRVPVIASVGHHTDRTLIDDVAAVSCSTPTHAAEVAVPVDVGAARKDLARAASRVGGVSERVLPRARTELGRAAVRVERASSVAVLSRARRLAGLSRAPAEHVARHRVHLHQQLRELRASSRRGVAVAQRDLSVRSLVIARKSAAASGPQAVEARSRLAGFAAALGAHDPQRTLERGYALVEDPSGEPVVSAAAARSLDRLTLRLSDGSLGVRPTEDTP